MSTGITTIILVKDSWFWYALFKTLIYEENKDEEEEEKDRREQEEEEGENKC